MITRQQYESFLRTATKKEITFINTYLKTLDAWQAFQEAGYNYNHARAGKWKVFNRLFPYIQYKLAEYNISVKKDFIVMQWLNLFHTGDIVTKQNALKELAKLFGYNDQSTKVEVNNNLQSEKVIIKFNNQN